ncbi:MAG: hypothetical protein HEEMFOPI_01427 [Holosporales bacterium]
MKNLGPKIFSTLVVIVMATGFFILTPLWVGLFLVIPGFSIFLWNFLKGDVQFVHNSKHHRSFSHNYKNTHKTESHINNHNLRGYGSLKERQRYLGY